MKYVNLFVFLTTIFLAGALGVAPPQQSRGMMGRNPSMNQGMGPGMGQRNSPAMMGISRMMQDPLRRAEIRAFSLPSMKQSLGLSSSQAGRLDEMKKQFVAGLRNTAQQIADKRATLNKRFQSGSPDLKQVEKAEMEIAKLGVEQRLSGYKTLRKMEEVLTPDQRARFKSMTPQELRNNMMTSMTVADMAEMMRLMHGSMGGAMTDGSGMHRMRSRQMDGGQGMGGMMGPGMRGGMGHMGMGQSQAQSTSNSPGEQAFAANCAICHNADSTAKKAGPGLKGLYRKTKLANGKKVTDQNVRSFLETSHPGMPSFANRLTTEQMDQLIAYLKTL